jgi:lipoate-protein ligase B
MSRVMSLSPILYRYFSSPLPYLPTLALQETIHHIQLSQRHSHPDVLLLLQHRPVYTTGRRQSSSELDSERIRLSHIGADFVATKRGGQTTFHGPGQLVGYPLLDLSRFTPTMSIREYICRVQRTLRMYLLRSHGIKDVPSHHTGVFLDPNTKIASIGIQVRHRLTSHGFALNLTSEPLPWFDQVVACGLDDVKAGSVESASGKKVKVEVEVESLVEVFGEVFGRRMEPFLGEGDIGPFISAIEEKMPQPWDTSTAPRLPKTTNGPEDRPDVSLS